MLPAAPMAFCSRSHVHTLRIVQTLVDIEGYRILATAEVRRCPKHNQYMRATGLTAAEPTPPLVPQFIQTAEHRIPASEASKQVAAMAEAMNLQPVPGDNDVSILVTSASAAAGVVRVTGAHRT